MTLFPGPRGVTVSGEACITNQLLRRPCPSFANRLKYCGLTLTGVHSHSIVPHRRRRRSDDDYLLLLYLRLCSVLLCGVWVCGGGGGQWWKFLLFNFGRSGHPSFLRGIGVSDRSQVKSQTAARTSIRAEGPRIHITAAADARQI